MQRAPNKAAPRRGPSVTINNAMHAAPADPQNDDATNLFTVCFGTDLRIADGPWTAVVGRVRRGARCVGDDDAGRYDHGDVGGS